jgi:uncharacterized pyridoxamine 5'-phosphate oxidase family protein
MINYVEILEKNLNGVLATQDGDKVKTRVFQFLFAYGKKAYFCTSSDKPVFKRLQANPNVSFCVFSPDFSLVLSISGKVVFDDDLVLKAKAIFENPLIGRIHLQPNNPIFKLFYIDVEEVKTFSFAEGPKTYSV